MPILTDSRHFIRNEFSNIELGDKRLTKRLLHVAESVNANPSFSIPAMTNAENSQLKGIYRFFQNPKVSEEKILQTHYLNTVERMDSCKGKILLLNDSCFVTPAKGMEGLMSRGKGKENCVRVHYCLAISEDGKQLLGILDFNVLSHPISKKHPELRDESDIWIKTAENSINHIHMASNKGEQLLSRCLFITDREGDEFELMEFLCKNSLGFIIRSRHNRNIEVEGKEKKLIDALKSSKKHGASYKIITQKGNKKSEVRVQRSVLRDISIIPPVTHKNKSHPLKFNMVMVKEVDALKDPTEWRLWTTEDLANAQSSGFVVEGYTHRWKIEEVNKGAKTGVRVEERQFTDLAHFTPFLAMAFVVAWRMVALRTVVEISPETKLTKAFQKDEILYLKAQSRDKGLKMKVVKDALYLIARLGGFTGSYKRPGWQVLWQGWIKFYFHVEGFKLAKKVYSR